MISSVLSLQQRLDLFVSNDLNAGKKKEYRIERLVSYNNGESWAGSWVGNRVGKFSSVAAAAITGDSLDTFIAARGMDKALWLGHLAEYADFRNAGFVEIPKGTFSSAPSICLYGTSQSSWPEHHGDDISTTYNHLRVIVFVKGMDDKIWWKYTFSAATQWGYIGAGVFNSSPAAACSATGNLLLVFARGMNNNIFWAFSTDKGAVWKSWYQIGNRVFQSKPAAACSADGTFICVFATGTDDRIYWGFSTDSGAHWSSWYPIGEGVFTSGPAVACSWNGDIIHVFARGKDNCIWQTRSTNKGAQWDIGWRRVDEKEFLNLNINF